MTKKKESRGFDLKPYMYIFGGVGLLFSIGIIQHARTSDKHLLSFSIVALIAGLIFESKRITEKWSDVFAPALGSYVFSFFEFLPGKHEKDYNFDSHVQLWPYAFLFFYITFFLAFNKKKATAKLTEGITLFQSIAVIYWVIDYRFINTDSVFLISLMGIGLLFAVYSIYQAFSMTPLSKTTRLNLSIWSSMIMMLFAVDYIIRVYQDGYIEDVPGIPQKLFTGIDYFLLGISSIYIAQNIFMLIEFLPGKNKFFNEEYFRDLKELKEEHINRFSDQQVPVAQSLVCVIFAGSFFSLNYYYQLLPRQMAIWAALLVFQLILFLYNYKNNPEEQTDVN